MLRQPNGNGLPSWGGEIFATDPRWTGVSPVIPHMQENPFACPIALRHSSMHRLVDGALEPAPGVHPLEPAFLVETHGAFHSMIAGADYPCVGAKAAINGGTYNFAVYDELGSVEATAGLARDLCNFAQSLEPAAEYSTLVAVFRGPTGLDEAAFETKLWEQLRALDAAQTEYFEWDHHVSADPSDPHFSFSFAGRAFYVIGIHGNSSRQARRFEWPALVFNPHEQFERLRSDGKWKRMQAAIRARDEQLQGSINPMVSDFGEISEARQYSGRAVPDDWTPPDQADGSASAPTSSGCPFAHHR